MPLACGAVELVGILLTQQAELFVRDVQMRGLSGVIGRGRICGLLGDLEEAGGVEPEAGQYFDVGDMP